MSRKSQDNLVAILLVAFCLILYFNSLWNTFVFDDLHTIKDNLYIKDLRYSCLFFKGHYTSVPIPAPMFRPFLLLTFSFNYLFNGLQPLGYHIINILLHFLNGILLYSFLRFLKRDLSFGVSLVLSLLFISHPINTQAVGYITCRSDLLVTLFIVLAFFSYAKGRLFLPIILYILALMSKETGLVFPFLVLAFDSMKPLISDYSDSKKIPQIKFKYIFYTVLIGISIFYWIYRGIIFGSSAKAILQAPFASPLRSFWSNILTQSVVSLFYLRLFIWPHPLNIHHTFPELNSLLNPSATFSLITIIIIIFLILFLRKKYLLISFGLAWYLICLLPKFYAVLNIVAAEHHFYLPSIGIYIILAALTQKIYLRWRKQFIYIAICIISAFTILTWFRNYEWRDTLSLWKSAAKVDPSSAIAQHNLGVEYLEGGEYSQAEKHFRKALSLSNLVEVQVNARIGLAKSIWQSQRRFTDAEAILKEALEINPKDYHIYQFLGDLYMTIGREQEAEGMWREGLGLNPYSADIQVSLGQLYLRKGKFSEAKVYFQSAIENNPDSTSARLGLGTVLENEDLNQAIEEYKKAIKLDSQESNAYYKLGLIYAQKLLSTQAEWYFKKTIELKPDFAPAYYNLCIFYLSLPQPNYKLALEYFNKAKALGYKVDPEIEEILQKRDPPDK